MRSPNGSRLQHRASSTMTKKEIIACVAIGREREKETNLREWSCVDKKFLQSPRKHNRNCPCAHDHLTRWIHILNYYYCHRESVLRVSTWQSVNHVLTISIYITFTVGALAACCLLSPQRQMCIRSIIASLALAPCASHRKLHLLRMHAFPVSSMKLAAYKRNQRNTTYSFIPSPDDGTDEW